jgi:hypothetical protein
MRETSAEKDRHPVAPIIINRELIDVDNVITPRHLLPIPIIHGKNFSIIITGPVLVPLKGRDKSFVVQRLTRDLQIRNLGCTVAWKSRGTSHIYDTRSIIRGNFLLSVGGSIVLWCGILFWGICALEGYRLFGLFFFERHGDQL